MAELGQEDLCSNVAPDINSSSEIWQVIFLSSHCPYQDQKSCPMIFVFSKKCEQRSREDKVLGPDNHVKNFQDSINVVSQPLLSCLPGLRNDVIMLGALHATC